MAKLNEFGGVDMGISSAESSNSQDTNVHVIDLSQLIGDKYRRLMDDTLLPKESFEATSKNNINEMDLSTFANDGKSSVVKVESIH